MRVTLKLLTGLAQTPRVGVLIGRPDVGTFGKIPDCFKLPTIPELFETHFLLLAKKKKK